jgi:hypothetical protein
MNGVRCVLAIGLSLLLHDGSRAGQIEGIVLNASEHDTPSPHTDVVLRVRIDGQFVPVAQTVTDAEGRFTLTGLPSGKENLYLPGANRAGVHYPGRRIRLTASAPRADVTLSVCDAVTDPNPLVIRRHRVLIRSQTGVLRVTESITVDNPTRRTYVGPTQREGEPPTTLRLAIPSDFKRVTFHEEFFGRQFTLRDGQLVTSIPWTPGERELEFTYTLGQERSRRAWQRPLDLPCDLVQVRVEHDPPEDVSCNLPSAPASEEGDVAFQSTAERLAAGHVIRVQLGRLPIAWVDRAKWGALVLLVGMIGTTYVLIIRRPARAAVPADEAPRPDRRPSSPQSRKGRSRRVRHRQVTGGR